MAQPVFALRTHSHWPQAHNRWVQARLPWSKKMLGLFESNKNKALRIDEKTPITKADYVIVDTELTGLDEKKDSIVSIGAVRMSGGTIELGNTFYRLVSPRTELTAQSVVIHEITPTEVESKPGIADVLGDFFEFCGDRVLVGHFISIDVSFLNREMKRTRRTGIRNPVLDTFSIYEWLRNRNKSRDCLATPLAGYRLHDIAKCFGIPVNGAHNAVIDAFVTAQLLQRFFPLLVEAGVDDIGDLLRIGTPFEGGDSFRLTNEFGNF
jgi:DNA polymerase-3 subunit epsilon